MLVIRHAVDIVLREEADEPTVKRRQDVVAIALRVAPDQDVFDLDKLVALMRAEVRNSAAR
jgi:hypothetical protein